MRPGANMIPAQHSNRRFVRDPSASLSENKPKEQNSAQQANAHKSHQGAGLRTKCVCLNTELCAGKVERSVVLSHLRPPVGAVARLDVALGTSVRRHNRVLADAPHEHLLELRRAALSLLASAHLDSGKIHLLPRGSDAKIGRARLVLVTAGTTGCCIRTSRYIPETYPAYLIRADRLAAIAGCVPYGAHLASTAGQHITAHAWHSSANCSTFTLRPRAA
eukprot:6114472-Pleurochrysis_carterae.AAC.4